MTIKEEITKRWQSILKGEDMSYLITTPNSHQEFHNFLLKWRMIDQLYDHDLIVKEMKTFPYRTIWATSSYDGNRYNNLFKYSLVPIMKGYCAIMISDLWRDPHLNMFVHIENVLKGIGFRENYEECPICGQFSFLPKGCSKCEHIINMLKEASEYNGR